MFTVLNILLLAALALLVVLTAANASMSFPPTADTDPNDVFHGGVDDLSDEAAHTYSGMAQT